jgi:hypothetical protein
LHEAHGTLPPQVWSVLSVTSGCESMVAGSSPVRTANVIFESPGVIVLRSKKRQTTFVPGPHELLS